MSRINLSRLFHSAIPWYKRRCFLYTSQQLSMPTIKAKAHPNRNLLNRLVYDTTSWKFILALLWCSTLPMQWWWFVCPTTYLWILDRQLRGPQVYLQSRRGFKIFHLNVRSITHKMDSIRLLLKDNNLDVLTVSETWLSPKVTDTEITFPGY